ncbi:MAG: dihydrodipicolinate synthase family protein [Woeseia sp.]
MDRSSVDWRGYIPAITTPFDEHGDFDTAMLRELIEWLVAEGMHGLIVAGTTGEWFSLTAQERQELFRVAGQAVKGRIPVIAGCSAYTANEAIAHAQAAKDAGLSGILLTPPPYVKPCEREILAFYSDVNRNVDLPICVYNWPPGTGVDMRTELLQRLADLERVVAIKNATACASRQSFIDVLESLTDRVLVFGVSTDEDGARMVLDYNAAGLMGAGAVLGRTHPEFFNALWRGEMEKALMEGKRDRAIMTQWFNEDYTAKFGSAQAVFKSALNIRDLPGGYPRRPILPLESHEEEIIRGTLQELRFAA